MKDLISKFLLSSSVRSCLEIMEEHYGFAHSTFHLLSNAKSGCDNPFVRTTYPESWVSYYLLNNLAASDPVVAHSIKTKTAFNWTEIEHDAKSLSIMEKAAEFGLGESGFTCPYMDSNGRVSILSVNSDKPAEEWAAFLAENQDDLVFLAQDLHIKALSEAYADSDEPPLLSPREYECLQWTSEGKTYSEISIILGLSEHTVRSYLKVARLKLNSVSLAQAVGKASNMGLF